MVSDIKGWNTAPKKPPSGRPWKAKRKYKTKWQRLFPLPWALPLAAFVVLSVIMYFGEKETEAKYIDLQDEATAHQLRDEATIESLKSSLKFYQDIEQKQRDEIQKKLDDIKHKEEVKRKHAEFIQSEVKCLADNVYHEAAHEPEAGQLAVATVTMNRLASDLYPKTVCGVVYERHLKKANNKIVCQFSWTCKPRYHMITSIYQQVMAMAREVYFKHERLDEVADALNYHATYIKTPNWANEEVKVATIGLHTFYKQ